MNLPEQSARREGQDAGFRQGRSDGYRIGLYDAVLKGLPALEEPARRDIRVLYVTAGIGVPYPALDQAVIEGLAGLVRYLTVASPSDDVAMIAGNVRPDLVLVLNGVVLPAEKVAQLRQAGFKTAVWFTDDPYYTDWTIAIAPRYDYVFTLELNCLPFYRQLGCEQVYYLPFAVNPAVFHPKRVPTSRQSDICFIGTAFWNRVELVDRLTPILAQRKVMIAGWWWDRLKNYDLLADKIKLGDWLSPEETASYYNGAKIVINLHRAFDDETLNANSRKIPAVSVNPRTFEISGCGTLQLSDIRQDMHHLYHPGTEIDTYVSDDELIQKIDYYLRHEEERQRVALGGFMRTRKDHTYRKRLGEMLSILFP
ncbi:CgeB family protein [Paenibacillus abyssi]|uniref:Spore maturation protein n=1 Tax=Paenibacillus abyssi TaxID=1340531 RepID=A0A917CUG5_9BACL|nr:glycosyltransferase [Paenibacillus abyssi]GGF98704.1 spore maturation protein [Paenibacillus abyssi]